MAVSPLKLLLLLTVYLSVRRSNGKVWPLDMAFKSVDDSFDGCKKEMFKLVDEKYARYEKKHTPGFSAAWEQARKNCFNGKLNINQSAAIYLYTLDSSLSPKCSYKQFNAACREGKQAYLSGKFQFYTLYYFLTEAVQALKPKRKTFPRKCVTVYRRTNENFTLVVPGQRIRFGSFVSSSLTKNLFHFGKVSCFKIKTCLGAELGKYSAVKYEQEVLIPPYEVFRITGINTKDLAREMKCRVVFELKSDGTKSALNCKKIGVGPVDQKQFYPYQ